MKTTLIMLVLGVCMGVGAGASAQTSSDSRFTVAINAAGQAESRTLNLAAAVPVFAETATVTGTQKVTSGPAFDAGVRYRLPRHFALGVSVSVFNRRQNAAITAMLPDPVFFNTFKSASATASGLRHTEIGTHVQFLYLRPLSDRVHVALSIGPSLIHVNESVAVATVDGASQALTVGSSRERGNAFGGNIGADLSFFPATRYGVGAFVRYTAGEAHLSAINHLRVGGVQAGAGFRFQF